MNRYERYKTWSDNCVKLADFLLDHVPDDAHDQGSWSEPKNNSCGTTGCAMGWSVAAGITPGVMEDWSKHGYAGRYSYIPDNDSWVESAKMYFGVHCYANVFLNTNTNKKETAQRLYDTAAYYCDLAKHYKELDSGSE